MLPVVYLFADPRPPKLMGLSRVYAKPDNKSNGFFYQYLPIEDFAFASLSWFRGLFYVSHEVDFYVTSLWQFLGYWNAKGDT